jgi:hypothetical protein
VPRAKRTDRTDARRRHRAEQAALTAAEPGAEGADASTAAATSAASGKATQAPPPQRPGIMGSVRAAYRQPHIMDDLRHLPQVVTNWGFLVAIAGSAAAVAWFVIAYTPGLDAVPVNPNSTTGLQGVIATSPIAYFVGTMVLQAPPAVGAFVIGFTAKRASWLGGLIYGIYTVILLLIVLATSAGRLITQDGSAQSVIVSSAAWAPMGACLFASALAWYRRFLDLANPNRGRQRQAQQSRSKAKPKTATKR